MCCFSHKAVVDEGREGGREVGRRACGVLRLEAAPRRSGGSGDGGAAAPAAATKTNVLAAPLALFAADPYENACQRIQFHTNQLLYTDSLFLPQHS